MSKPYKFPYRFPLAGSYNTRVSSTNTLSSSSGIVGAGIVGTMVVGAPRPTSTKDQRFINCFATRVVNPYTGQGTLFLVKRPGFATALTPAAGSIGNDVLVWTGSNSEIISSFGGTNSTIYSGTTSLGAITGKCTGLTETVIGSNLATILASSGDSTAWYYNSGVGSMTKITDGDFPGNAGKTLTGTFVHLDGFASIMDTNGVIWTSDLNSVTAWSALSFVSTNAYPDKGIGLARQGNNIVAFGTESTQWYYNAGNSTGSILSPITPATKKVGCVGPNAITQVADQIFFAGSTAQGGLSIYQLSGTPGAYQRISKPEIEAILIIAGAGSITLSSTWFYGRSFVMVTAATVTFVYCIEENSWHEWNSAVPLWFKCAGVSTGTGQVTYAVSNISTSGKVFTINPASHTYQDNGAAYTATAQTSKIGDGTRRIFWNDIELIADREESTSPVTISYTDDDYGSYNVLGTVDLSDARPRISRCGSAYRRAWQLTHSANTPFRIEAIAGRMSKDSR